MKLEPNKCPACGCDVMVETVNNKNRVRCIRSYDCSMKTPWVTLRDDAIAIWNARCKSNEPIIIEDDDNGQ